MQAVGALFTTLFTGGTTSLATAGTWAAANAGGAIAAGGAASSGILTALQGIGGAFSALSTIGSGAAAVAAGETEKRNQQFEAREEFVRGRETSAALKEELARTVANQAVSFAAGGVDLGSVSVGQAKDQATKTAERELSSTSNQTLSRFLQRQRLGRLAAARGKTAQIASLFQAGAQAADTGISILARG